MSEPTASDLAADVRAVLKNTVGIDARPPVEAMESLDALVARVDTLTRERDDQLKITHNVYGLLVDAKRERNAAEAEREQALKDAADYLAHLKAAEAALADTRRALECDHHETAWTFIEHEGEMWNICHDCGLMEKWAGGQRFAQQVDYERARALAAGDKP